MAPAAPQGGARHVFPPQTAVKAQSGPFKPRKGSRFLRLGQLESSPERRAAVSDHCEGTYWYLGSSADAVRDSAWIPRK